MLGESDHVHALVEASREEGLKAHVAVLLMLDAGFRLGEVRGLRWGRIAWGADGAHARRLLTVDRSIPQNGPPGPPKGPDPLASPTGANIPAAAPEAD